MPKTKKLNPDIDPLADEPVSSHVPDMPVIEPEKKEHSHHPEPKFNQQTQTIEEFVRYGEPRDVPDKPLPNMAVVRGEEEPEQLDESGNPTSKYHTTVNNASLGSNLISYPAIASGRCEICGATRFVHKKNGTKAEIWRIVPKMEPGAAKYRYIKGDWVEMHACNCPHYRNIHIQCAYCNEQFTATKDRKGSFTEKLAGRTVWVYAERTRPNDLIMCCSDFRCKFKFDEQYHLNQTL